MNFRDANPHRWYSNADAHRASNGFRCGSGSRGLKGARKSTKNVIQTWKYLFWFSFFSFYIIWFEKIKRTSLKKFLKLSPYADPHWQIDDNFVDDLDPARSFWRIFIFRLFCQFFTIFLLSAGSYTFRSDA